MKKKIITLITILTTSVILLAGCGFGDAGEENSGIRIHKDMSVEAVIIDDFDESIYDITELQNMLNSETGDFNSANGEGSVTAKDASVTDGRIKVVMDYSNADSYAGFNTRYFMIDNLDSVITQGAPGIAFKSVKDDNLVDITTLEGNDTYYMCVTDETGEISFPGKVICISDGVETITKDSVKVTENMDGLAYIIFSNK